MFGAFTFLDRDQIEQFYKKSAEKDVRLRDIVLKLVSSDDFTRR
ncbi:MAG: hypothetical protein PVJ98_07590 [Akkermansiaceae bacterium]